MKAIKFAQLKKDVVREHNRIRSCPQAYIPILERYMGYINDGLLEMPGSNVAIEMIEGRAAYEEAIDFLKEQKPLGELEFSEEVSKASQEHCDYLGRTGLCSHRGENNSTDDERVSKYVEWKGALSENIDFGADSGVEVVVSFLVDDGVEDREHRHTLFNKKLKHIGVGVGYHKKYEVCTVIDYVGGIVPLKGEGDSDEDANEDDTINLDGRGILCKLLIAKTKELLQTGKGIETHAFDNDPDAPKNTFRCLTKTITTTIGNQKHITTQKRYLLDNGYEEIVVVNETQSKSDRRKSL